MKKVICVGNAVVDIIVKNGPDRTPDGMTQFAESINMYVGGDAVNEAVALSAMGNDVKLYTAIGDDALGSAFMSLIEGCGIPTDGVVRDREYPTTATVVTVGARRRARMHDPPQRRCGEHALQPRMCSTSISQAPAWFPSQASSGAGARPTRI